MEQEITSQPDSYSEQPLRYGENKKKPTGLFILIVVLVVLGGAVAVPPLASKVSDSFNKTANTQPTQGAGKKSLSVLPVDSKSINTIVYGSKLTGSNVVLSAVNDSGKNKSGVSAISGNIKFSVPLSRDKLLFIGRVGSTDKGQTIEVSDLSDGQDKAVNKVLYEASDGYMIDTLMVSENGEWVTWSENKPETGSRDTHEKNYFRSFKASLTGVKSGQDSLTPIALLNEKSDVGVTVHLPAVVTNSGSVYFSGIKPVNYFLYDGFIDESQNVILATNTYNSKPNLGQERYLVYTSYQPLNNPKLKAENAASGRVEALNRNSVKVMDLQTGVKDVIIAGGTEGEHYNHPVYVSGDLHGDFTIAAEVSSKEGVDNKLTQKEIQLITRSASGKSTKKTLGIVPAGKKYRILAVDTLPDGGKAVLVGEETNMLGSLGTGSPVGSSGYQNVLSAMNVYPVTGGAFNTINFDSENAEFIGVLPKPINDSLGMARNMSASTELGARDNNQLQLETFAPIEQKRALAAPEKGGGRKECESGNGSSEDCVSCPIYVYSEKSQKVSLTLTTPIFEETSYPAVSDNSWTFVADRLGNLLFPNEEVYKKIDFLFPRKEFTVPQQGVVIAQKDFVQGLKNYAKDAGLNNTESSDAAVYFLPKIKDSEYVFVGTISQSDTKNLLDFEVTPKPSVQASRLFYIKKLSQIPAVRPQKPVSTPINRQGELDVITWGGVS